MAATKLMAQPIPLFAEKSAHTAKPHTQTRLIERLEDFTLDPTLADDVQFILTVKNVNLPQAENLHLNRPRVSMPRVIGVTEPRPYHQGVVLSVQMKDIVQNTITMESAVWSLPYVEVHGVDTYDDRYIAISGGTMITIYDIMTQTCTTFQSPWLQHLHTLQFSKDGKRILTASMGFDTIVEFCIETGAVTWEWCAWDHGYNQSLLGHYIVRKKEMADSLEGQQVMLIDDPAQYSEFGVPTRYRAVGVNAARYYDGDETKISATFFHTGDVVLIERNNTSRTLLSESLFAPHGFTEITNGNHIVSSTREGRILIAGNDFGITHELRLEGMGGTVRQEELGEWLQTTKQLPTSIREQGEGQGDMLFAALDIHRSKIWFVDWEHRRYRGVDVPRGWALQDIFVAPPVWFGAPLTLAQYRVCKAVTLTHPSA